MSREANGSGMDLALCELLSWFDKNADKKENITEII